MKVEDVTIVGAGPAGIAAAIQLKRWGIEPLLLEADHVGGLLVNANLVENYPGFPDGISGIDLVELFKSQLARVDVVARYEEVLEIDHDENFKLRTSKREFESKFAVIASGTQPSTFDSVSIPKEVIGKVFYEVYPIIGVEGKIIAIIGAGDAAFDYAMNLSRKNEVTILNRGSKRKCLPLLWERTQKSAHISYNENTALYAIADNGNRLVLKCKIPPGDWELVTDYVIFAIGRKPRMGFLSKRLTELASELKKEGTLFFVGDVANDIYRQTTIAVGDGVRAAMKICEKFGGTD